MAKYQRFGRKRSTGRRYTPYSAVRRYGPSGGTPYKRRKTGMRTYRSAPVQSFGYANPTKQELKSFDTVIAAQGSGAAGGLDVVIGSLVPSNLSTQPLLLLNGIPIGNDIYQRIGRKVQMQAIYLRFHLQYWGGMGQNGAPPLANQPVPLEADAVGITVPDGPAFHNPLVVRCMLVYDKQPNGVAATVSNVLEDTSTNLNSQVNPTCPNRLAYRDRFVTIWDRTYHLDRNGVNAIPVKVYKKLNLGCTFIADGGVGLPNDITHMGTGALYFLYVGDIKAPARVPVIISQYTVGAQPTVPTEATAINGGIINNFWSRVRYTDS